MLTYADVLVPARCCLNVSSLNRALTELSLNRTLPQPKQPYYSLNKDQDVCLSLNGLNTALNRAFIELSLNSLNRA